MSYGHDICVPGLRRSLRFGHLLASDDLAATRLFVRGRHWAFNTRCGGPTITTRHWYSPDLEWFAEFKAECEEFEWTGKGWRAERDGYEYWIPERWSEQYITREEW